MKLSVHDEGENLRVRGTLRPLDGDTLPERPVAGKVILRSRDGSMETSRNVRLKLHRGDALSADGRQAEARWLEVPNKDKMKMDEVDVIWVSLSNRELFMAHGLEESTPELAIAERLAAEPEYDSVILSVIILQAKTLANKAERDAKPGEMADYDAAVQKHLSNQRQPDWYIT